MIIKYSLTLKDFKELQKVQIMRKKNAFIIIILIWVVLFIFNLYVFIVDWVKHDRFPVFTWFIWCITSLFPVLVIINTVKRWEVLYKQYEKFLKGLELDITENEILYKTVKSSIKLQKSDILEIRENKNIWAFLYTDMQAIVVPKRFVNEKTEFKKIVDKLRNRYSRIK